MLHHKKQYLIFLFLSEVIYWTIFLCGTLQVEEAIDINMKSFVLRSLGGY